MNAGANLISVNSYPGRLVNKIPLPYWMSLLILWELIFLSDYIYSLNIPGGHDHIAVFGTITLFFAFVSITMVYCSHILINLYPDLTLFIDHDHQELKAWYERKLKWCYEGIWPLIAGVLFAIVEEFTIGDQARTFTPDHPVLQGCGALTAQQDSFFSAPVFGHWSTYWLYPCS